MCLPVDTFTYLSPSHNTTSWLDHVLASSHDLITDVSVVYDKTIYDHFPLRVLLNLNTVIVTKPFPVRNININSFTDWAKMTTGDVQKYQSLVSHYISNISNEALMCKTLSCCSESHKLQLNEAYESLITILLKSSQDFSYSVKERRMVVPGWNDCCKSLYHIAREKFLIWKNNGKCRYGPEFEDMKKSRKNFKESFKACKNNEDYYRNTALATSFANKNDTILERYQES